MQVGHLLDLAPAGSFTDDVLVLPLVFANHQWDFFFVNLFKSIVLHNILQHILGPNGLLRNWIVESTQPFTAWGEFGQPAEWCHQNNELRVRRYSFFRYPDSQTGTFLCPS